ncbi:MAG: Fe-S oxidoreductase [Gammaproteobacteria bacterium]|nr:Fe-S oxidoreductase [Gammaproteobacteria bacterium]
MSTPKQGYREGNLQAPTRHALQWQDAAFYDEQELFTELERIFDICHGCRRCVSLCHAFPTLFDLVDASATMEVDGVAKQDYWKVVEHCYLCDLCYMTKCPYVPPHEWNLDFPHVMLRAKAVKFKNQGASVRDKILSATDAVGKFAGIPIVVQTVNTVNRMPTMRKAIQAVLGVHENALVPDYHHDTLRKRRPDLARVVSAKAGTQTKGKVALFITCYGNYNEPQLGEDLIAVLQHNEIEVRLVDKEQCCGMPKLELGDLQAVDRAKQANIPQLAAWVDAGYDIIAPVPSCVLMFKQEIPLMYPADTQVQQVKSAIYDPFEYLMLRHKEGLLKTDFHQSLGHIAYHVACHQRVQNIGLKTRDVLALVPDTKVTPIERCSGHDGTYAVKQEYHEIAMKIAKPIVNRVKEMQPDHYASDCPIAGRHIQHGMDDASHTEHPIQLLRKAYGI